eukprot:gene118-2450_t
MYEAFFTSATALRRGWGPYGFLPYEYNVRCSGSGRWMRHVVSGQRTPRVVHFTACKPWDRAPAKWGSIEAYQCLWWVAAAEGARAREVELRAAEQHTD